MKRNGIMLLVLLLAATLPLAASGQSERANASSALCVPIEGPDHWEPGSLDRILIELTPIDGKGEALRASLPMWNEFVVISDVAPGTYTVTRARYGLPDGSFVAEVKTPEEPVAIASGGIQLAPFSLDMDNRGPEGVAWKEISLEDRIALAERLGSAKK